MKFNITLNEFSPDAPARVGNVYHVKGGYGTRAGHMMILVAVAKDQSGLMLVVTKDGDPVGVSTYLLSRLEERMPIAFVPGLSDLTFDMVPL